MSRTIHLEPEMPDVQQQINDAPEGMDIVFHGTFEGLTIQPKNGQHFLMGTLKGCRFVLSPDLAEVEFRGVHFIRYANDGQKAQFEIPHSAGVSFIGGVFELVHVLSDPALSPGE